MFFGNTKMDSIILIYLVVGILFIAISIPLIKRKVKINNWYGVRLPQTMKNEKIWYAVNEKSGKHLFAFGTAIILFSILFYIGNFFSSTVSFVIMTVLILIDTIIIVIKASSISNKLSKTK